MSAHTQQKATRLLAEGRVRPSIYNQALGPQQFDVEGDTDRYVTVVGASVRMCSCKRWRETMLDCSHIEAACIFVNAKPDERALIEEVLALRKERDRVAIEAAFEAL